MAVVPRKVRKRDDWNAVLAAEHLLSLFGSRATNVVEQREKAASDLFQVRRWHAIGVAIRQLEKRERH